MPTPRKKKTPAPQPIPQPSKNGPGTAAFARTFIDMYKSMFEAMQNEYGADELEKMAAIAVQVRDTESDDFATMFAGTERQMFKLVTNMVSYLVHQITIRKGSPLSPPDLANQICRDMAIQIGQSWSASHFNHIEPPPLSSSPPPHDEPGR